MTQRYNTLSQAFRRIFGRRAKKIPLDAGSACPNRDGALSRAGCLFCNATGSGTGLYHKGFGLRAQWDKLTAPARGRGEALIAYLQSFSNTYGPASRLEGLLGELIALPGVCGLCLGTRPDCLDAEKTALLAAVPLPYVCLDLGLQSVRDATLTRINRGHDAAAFALAARGTAEAGLRVTAHLMAGLPGESNADFWAAVSFINDLPVTGVKFHNTLVVAGSSLAELFAAGGYVPPGRETYVAAVAEAIARLRPDIVVERLNADPAPGELVAPAWAADKRGVREAIAAALEEGDIRQGCRRDATRPPP
ncbi:Radical SAM domain protein [Solidesulfovibrio fructosivorans JJ]]|uniref:Radical SAM domain protein n=1 Tax=Solidesulfovibrio fructosivorans JJ] TaxID=596151 RepID=E1JRT6_SOLFR|nr:TIGR01212 family radical SAM protein [Solidesulfovibrio fructosivorans]EFL52705.1 Radical SAM domain protein [Solidesulfovibrio fructosivorans JJ]]